MMYKKLWLPIAILTLLAASGAYNFALPRQDNSAPLSKQDILALLNRVASRQLSQADVATEVDRRGIAFAVDEKTLSEFQKNGARAFVLDAIKRAAAAPPPKPTDPSDPSATMADEETRQRAQAQALAQKPLLEQTKHYALEYVNDLPDFITEQVVKRYLQAPGTQGWELRDTVEIEVTYSSAKGEQFKVLRLNGKPVDKSYEDLQGSTSTGEFGSMLTALFMPHTKTVFKEVKKELFNGKQTVVYDFAVAKENSNSTLSDKGTGKTTVTGYRGSIWIDKETKKVLRVESSSEGIPAGFPVSMAENSVEYDWVKIDGETYLLPARAEVIMGKDREKVYTRNVIEFRNYRKFEAKIKIQ